MLVSHHRQEGGEAPLSTVISFASRALGKKGVVYPVVEQKGPELCTAANDTVIRSPILIFRRDRILLSVIPIPSARPVVGRRQQCKSKYLTDHLKSTNSIDFIGGGHANVIKPREVSFGSDSAHWGAGEARQGRLRFAHAISMVLRGPVHGPGISQSCHSDGSTGE